VAFHPPAFNGTTATHAKRPAHIITGAGGGTIHSAPMPAIPKPSCGEVVLNTHCFSVLDIKGDTVEFRQVDRNGHVVDSFKLTK
jgi:hypothetical protein